jgi:hypothetical protein
LSGVHSKNSITATSCGLSQHGAGKLGPARRHEDVQRHPRPQAHGLSAADGVLTTATRLPENLLEQAKKRTAPIKSLWATRIDVGTPSAKSDKCSRAQLLTWEVIAAN